MCSKWYWAIWVLFLTKQAEARSAREILYHAKGDWRLAWIDAHRPRVLREATYGPVAWRMRSSFNDQPLLGLSAGREGMAGYTKRCVLRWGLHKWKTPRCVAGFNEEIVDMVWTDLDGDGIQGIVVMIQTAQGDGRLVGIDAQTGQSMRLQIERIRGPWALDSADVDGDGREELLIGMFRPAYFDRVIRRRLWLYTYLPKEGALFPFWRGSRFSRPWLDFATIKGDHLRIVPSTSAQGWCSATQAPIPTQSTTKPIARARLRPHKKATPRRSSKPHTSPSNPNPLSKKPVKAWLAVLESAKGYPQRVMLYRWQSFGFVGEEYATLVSSWHEMRGYCSTQQDCFLWMLAQAPSQSLVSTERLSFLAALLSRKTP